MRSEYGHIDDAFRDKLKDIEISAPIDAWEGISEGIVQPKNKRFLWYKVAASVAALAIVGSLFWMVSNNEINTEQDLSQEILMPQEDILTDVKPLGSEEQVAQNTNQTVKIEIEDNQDIKSKAIEQSIISNTNSDIEIAKEKPNQREEANYKMLEAKAVKISNVQLQYTLADIEIKKTETTIFEPEIDLLLAYSNMEVESKEELKESKWMLGGDATPLYSYRSIAKSDAQYNAAYYNSVESPAMTYTGGINLQYKALNRLSIQAGVYYTEMGQSLDYMTVYSNKAYEMVADEYKDRFVNAYDLDNSAGKIRFKTSYVIVDEIAARVNDLSSNKGFVNTADPVFQDMEADIQQKFKYIEVPIMLRYKLIDRLVDFNIVGGIGANFLVGNDVILSYGNHKEIIGETQGVDPIHYTSSFGFGIEYPLMKRLNFRLEPSIKYYLNSISSTSSVESHPYSIGVYTGINYTF